MSIKTQRHPPTHMTQHHLVSTTTTTMMAPLILIQNVYMHIYIFAKFLSIFLFLLLFVTLLVLFLCFNFGMGSYHILYYNILMLWIESLL